MKTCPRCGAKVEVYRASCDCGFNFDLQTLSGPPIGGEFPGEFRAASPWKSPGRTYVWFWVIGVFVLGVGIWHLVCTERLEASIHEHIRSSLADASINGTVEISVQPISNLVSIDIRFLEGGVGELKPLDKLLIDAMLVYIRSQVEPFMERELSLVARKHFDLYAMIIPYRAAISLDIVPR